MIDAIKHTPAESITVEKTASRQTPPPAGEKFAQVLKQGALTLLDVAGSAASALPAGGMLSAAVRSASAQAGQTPSGLDDPRAPAPAVDAGATGSSTGDIDQMWALQEAGVRSNLEVLKLQESISRDNRVFSTLSNVMKARHETARTAIGNIR
jgi:hypothetical protein